MSFELEHLSDGDLKLKIVRDEEEIDRDWNYLLRRRQNGTGLYVLMDERGYIDNGWLVLTPSMIGEPSEPFSPLLCDSYTDLESEPDTGNSLVVYGNIWWCPSWWTRNPVEALRDDGEVVFNLKHKAGLIIRERNWECSQVRENPITPITRPHGLCERSCTCLEHVQDPRVPSCKRRGKGRRVL